MDTTATFQGPYFVEPFSEAEEKLLGLFFTSATAPAFGIFNMPDVVKGALFGRYSRSNVSLRRLFLDEFINRRDIAPAAMAELSCRDRDIDYPNLPADQQVRLISEKEELWKQDKSLGIEALARLAPDTLENWLFGATAHAESFYRRVFGDYGDDSVAQLGSAHVAMEQLSNLGIKDGPERSRTAVGPLEQSTRYLNYGAMVGGRFRYHRAVDIMSGPHAAAYEEGMNARFEAYRRFLPIGIEYFQSLLPKDVLDADSRQKNGRDLTAREYKTAIETQTFDAIRGVLPIGTYSHLGMHASAQAFETMVVRMLASPLPELQQYARFVQDALNHPQMIPAFMTGVGRPDRGGAKVEYFAQTREAVRNEVANTVERHQMKVAQHQESVALNWHDPEGEYRAVAAILYDNMPAGAHWSLEQCLNCTRQMTTGELDRLIDTAVGERSNRRHKPGRWLEEVWYAFDILSSYAVFRDLQRHRPLTIDWQEVNPYLGFVTPIYIEQMGLAAEFSQQMEEGAELYELLRPEHPVSCQYAVPMAYRLRYRITMNAREAMHLTEIRTGEQGHPEYRAVAQQMHRLISEVHPRIGGAMRWVDYNEYNLARLSALQRQTEKRQELGIDDSEDE